MLTLREVYGMLLLDGLQSKASLPFVQTLIALNIGWQSHDVQFHLARVYYCYLSLLVLVESKEHESRAPVVCLLSYLYGPLMHLNEA